MAASFIPLETVRGLDRGPLVPHVGAYVERARSAGGCDVADFLPWSWQKGGTVTIYLNGQGRGKQ
jgi:hypothetical protein